MPESNITFIPHPSPDANLPGWQAEITTASGDSVIVTIIPINHPDATSGSIATREEGGRIRCFFFHGHPGELLTVTEAYLDEFSILPGS